MCNIKTHPPFVASEIDECKENVKNLEIQKYIMCVPKVDMRTNWELGTVTVDQVIFPRKEDKDVLLTKLTHTNMRLLSTSPLFKVVYY